MIRVTAEPGRLTVQGHADYAPEGQDIVCAGVSALVLALADRGKEKGLAQELVLQPGYARIMLQGAEPETELVLCGLRQLEKRYPQCVQVKEETGHFSR